MSSEDRRKQIKDIASDEVLRLFNERPDEIILQELKDAYNRQWDLKDSDERKATGIVTISGIITSLLFGFTGFLHNITTITYDYVIFLIGVSVIANALAVLLSILSLRIKNYRFMLTNVKMDIIFGLRAKSKPQVIDELIKEYHEAINDNSRNNESKAKLVKIANWFLFAGIANIALLLGVSQLR